MKIFLPLTLSLSMATLLMGCGNLVKSGAIIEAQNALNEKAYAEALENTEIAESFGDLSVADTAKLHFLRAQSLEGLGRQEEAVLSYQYVLDQHGSSAYARPAERRLEALSTQQ